MLFGRKTRTETSRKKSHTKIPEASYDHENQRPILRCSICTGEQVAGFKNIHTGRFEEVMLIRNDRELREFMEQYGVSEVTREY